MLQGLQIMTFRINNPRNIVSSFIQPFKNLDLMIAFCLFMLGLLTRLPFASRMIYAGDSARFALALEHYDVAQMRPHAPGYILYVAIAKSIDLFVHDARVSLLAVSVFSTALMAFFLYFLASKMFGRSNGFFSSLLLLSSPLFWFNGEIPFTYTLEGLFIVIFAFTCYKIVTGEKKWLVVSAIILGIATGVRQNIIIMFLPLWLYSIRKCSFKQIFISFIAFGVTCLAWFAPMIMLTGGLVKYFAAVQAQFTTWVLHPASFLFQIKGRWNVFAIFMIYSLTLGLIPIFYYFGQFFRIPSIVGDVRHKMLILWFLPAFLFFIAIQVFNPGHVIVILPPLFIYLSESIKGLSLDLEKGIRIFVGNSSSKLRSIVRSIFSYRAILISTVSILLLLNVYIFIFKDTQVSYAAIQKKDSRLAEIIKLTKDNFVPEKTMILTFLYNTQAGFYLPDFLVYCPFPIIFSQSEIPIESQNVYISFRHQTTPKTYWLPTGFKIEPIVLPAGINTVILWEKEIAEYYQKTCRPLKEIHSTGTDDKIYYFEIGPEEQIYYNYKFLTVR
jgi:dolichyl-phosphate-mannose-protein mannosyltransferase